MRSLTFRARDKSLELGERTALMAVVNVTPDSFFAGSRSRGAGEAADRALALVDEGADILDIGGESTRPGASEVDAEEEARRVIPVIERLAGTTSTSAILSVDTRKAEVARRALEAGADMVNDVSSLGDEGMASLVAREEAGLALMHMKGTPATMQREPVYEDVVAEVRSHLSSAVRRAERAGVAPSAILVDPGIGFGKTLEHNLALLSHLEALHALEKPVLVGTSRKSFIGRLTGLTGKTGKTAEDRLMGSVASAVAAALRGAHILRVHDVAATREALEVADALKRAEAPSRVLQGAAR